MKYTSILLLSIIGFPQICFARRSSIELIFEYPHAFLLSIVFILIIYRLYWKLQYYKKRRLKNVQDFISKIDESLENDNLERMLIEKYSIILDACIKSDDSLIYKHAINSFKKDEFKTVFKFKGFESKYDLNEKPIVEIRTIIYRQKGESELGVKFIRKATISDYFAKDLNGKSLMMIEFWYFIKIDNEWFLTSIQNNEKLFLISKKVA